MLTQFSAAFPIVDAYNKCLTKIRQNISTDKLNVGWKLSNKFCLNGWVNVWMGIGDLGVSLS